MESTTARERRFIFEDNREAMVEFAEQIKDIVVPYSESRVKLMEAERKRHKYKLTYGSFREGLYATGGVCGPNRLYAKIEPDDFKDILESGLFEKRRICRDCYEYVYVG